MNHVGFTVNIYQEEKSWKEKSCRIFISYVVAAIIKFNHKKTARPCFASGRDIFMAQRQTFFLTSMSWSKRVSKRERKGHQNS